MAITDYPYPFTRLARRRPVYGLGTVALLLAKRLPLAVQLQPAARLGVLA